MNERIKELMDQAGIDVEAVESLGEMPTAMKFAELIVRECLDIAIKEECWAPQKGPVEIGIREHFGVEE
jgi:hypothetical protein